MNEIIPAVEMALSDVWRGSVQLSPPRMLENRRHIARLDVLQAPRGMPKTVILKRWRSKDDEGFDPDTFANHFLNDWASLELMASIFGNEPLAPQVYIGDQKKGFLVIEDMLAGNTLDTVLQGNDAAQAERAFMRYGETLGRLHVQTLDQSEDFISLRHKLGCPPLPEQDGHLLFLQRGLKILEELDFKVLSTAYMEVQQVADLLSRDTFSTFHHGDPIPSNCWVDSNGGFYLFDFESAHFGHALLEAVNPRMSFPTCGMAFVNRVLEATWRRAGSAYRAVLVKNCPEAADETIYGRTIAAACALWTLAFCQGWLERAIVSTDSRINRVRQCALVRFSAIVLATMEFDSLSALGETFINLVADLRSRWPPEAQELPCYPALQASNSG